MTENVFELNNLQKYYPVTRGFLKRVVGHVKAVDGITLNVKRGETLGVVGESGCGKTTLGKTLMMLEAPTGGKAVYNDGETETDLTRMSAAQLFDFKKHVQMIFQDPYSSLNPLKTIYESFDEPLRVHHMGDKQKRSEIMERMLSIVNMHPDHLKRYPHEFSGGQRQRLCIARALSLSPDVVVCDEPVSALDVSIQAQVLNLMKDIQRELNLTYVFIAHDLSVVQYMSDRIAVMYLGKVVEIADAYELYRAPTHPYTQSLLSAIPVPVIGGKKERIVLPGDVPSPIHKPSGCGFHTRCRFCTGKCKETEPELRPVGGDEKHLVACHLNA